MKVLVIGGTRFTGPFVVRGLVAAGHEVSVFHRGTTAAELPEGVSETLGEREALKDFRPVFRRLAPDVIVDMVPMNERDARTLVETFTGIAGRTIVISSEDVYRAYDIMRGLHPGPPDPVPLTEESPLRERLFPYDREGVRDYEKILVERAIANVPDLPGTVLRLPAVYGPGDYQHRLFPYLRRMDDGRPAILLEEGLARWRWTMGYVEDTARAIARAATAERAANRVYNVGERDSLTHSEWVRAIGEAAGWDGEVVSVPKEQLPEHLDLGLANTEQHLVVDTSRIRDELGFGESFTREEALRRTIEWERENPPKDMDPSDFDYAAEDETLASLGSNETP